MYFCYLVKHCLTVGARVGEFEAEAAVKILVEDVNEYRPVFTRETYETQITEEDDRDLPKPILRVRFLAVLTMILL